jgi:hypothetical protein
MSIIGLEIILQGMGSKARFPISNRDKLWQQTK